VQRRRQSFALLAAAAICGALAFWFDADPAMLPWPALLAWAAGVGLLLAGAWLLENRNSGTTLQLEYPPASAGQEAQLGEDLRPANNRQPPALTLVEPRVETRTEYLLADELQDVRFVQPYARWEMMALLGLTLLALLARALALTDIPHNFGGDEGEMGMMARAVIRGELIDPFATGWLSHPTLWFFMQSFSLRVFGDTIFGLRMLSVLIGTATVPALYLFARPLYGRPVALAATALLAAYHFHIHFSRLAVNNIVDPLLALLAFAAFFHGYRTRSFFSFALAGALLGLAQHFYMGGRLTPLVLLVVLIHQLLIDRGRLWGLRWHLMLLALGFLLGFGPLLRFFLLHRDDFMARLAMVGIFQTGWFAQQQAQGTSALTILLNQARDAFGAFIYQPDRGAYYDPKIPMLDHASAVLFVLGLAVAIPRWRRPDIILLLTWLIGTTIFGGMLLLNSPESPRFLTTTPVLCLLIAMAIERLVSVLRSAVSLGQRLAYSLGGVTVLLLALWSLNFYFREYTPRFTFGWLNTEAATSIGIYLHDHEDAYVYFFGTPRMFITNGTIRFMVPGVLGTDVIQPITSPDGLPAPPPGRHPIFIFLPERAGELAIIQRRYPNGMIRQANAQSQDGPLFLSYEPK
jgi:hypothetical protein